jgi:hypothetical protein
VGITDFLLYLGGILGVGITIGGLVIAVRTGYSKAASDIQERVISALKEREELLSRRIEDLERNESRQNSIISTIRYALKQRGLKITIEGDFVTLSEASGKSSKVTRIQDRAALLEEDEATDAS